MKVYKIVGFIFIAFTLLEVIIIAMTFFTNTKVNISSYEYIGSFTSIFITGLLGYCLMKSKIWGYYFAVIIIPVFCIYHIYDSFVAHESDLVLIYSGIITGLFGYLLYLLIENAQSVYRADYMILKLKNKLMILPVLMFVAATYLFLSYFIINFIAIFIAILVFALANNIIRKRSIVKS